MRSPTSMRLLFISALLLATIVPSAEAGRVKGLKSSPAATRNLQKEAKGKEKVAKIPKNKVSGPQSRNCQSVAKKNEVQIECGTIPRSGKAGKADKGVKEVAAAKEVAAKKEVPSQNGVKAIGDKEGAVKEPKTRTIDETDTSTRKFDLTPSELIEDSIKYVVKTDKKGIKLAIEYRQEVATAISENKTETEFELMYESLVEYVKGEESQRWGFNNGVSTEAYNWDTDKIIQVIPLKNWEGIPGISQSDDGVVKYFTATASLDSKGAVIGPKGTAHFNFTVSEAAEGQRVSANSMKIDLNILNFPWQRRDSYIALMSTVDSRKSVHVEHSADALVSGGKANLADDVFVTFDEEMTSLGLEAFGAYTWEKNAEATTPDDDSSVAVERDGGRRAQEEEADPTIAEDVSAKPGAKPVEIQHAAGSVVTIEVVATSPEEQATENYNEIAYSFIGSGAHAAKEIYWDPEAGVGYGEVPVSAAWAFQSITWAASLAGAMLLMW